MGPDDVPELARHLWRGPVTDDLLTTVAEVLATGSGEPWSDIGRLLWRLRVSHRIGNGPAAAALRELWKRGCVEFGDGSKVRLVRHPQPQADAVADNPKRTRRGQWLGKALLLLRDHPDWSDAQIARELGINPSTLSRNPEYKRIASAARKSEWDVPRGMVSGGDLDAYHVDDIDDDE